MYANKHEIISAGCSEAAKMKSAVASVAADANVKMTARQFARLAGLIENLSRIALGDAAGGMGDPRYWVPLEEYARLRRENQRLAAQCAPFDLELGGLDVAPDVLAASRSLM